MQLPQMCERLSTKSTTPDDDVFSTPGASFFGQALLSSPRLNSTPPTSGVDGSGQNTPVPYHKRSSVKSLDTPWGVGLDSQVIGFDSDGIKLESTPPPSSQLPAAFDLSPTPASKSREATPNAVRPPRCCQISYAHARKAIRSAHDFPAVSNTSDESIYYHWATIVRNALMEGNMWKFVDGSHNDHSGTRFWRDGESRTADLIRWAYTKNSSDSSTANTLATTLSDTTFHMQASDLWDHIRAKHTGVTPVSSWNPSQDSLPPVSSAPPLPSDNFFSNSSRVYFLLQNFRTTTLAQMHGDVTAFANQLCSFEHRVKKLGSYLPAYQMKMQFLYNLEPEYRPKLRELEAAYGDALWRDEGGLAFGVVREVMVGEERRLREEASQRETEEVVRAEMDRLGEMEMGKGAVKGSRERLEGMRRERARVSEERRKRADAAEERLRAAMDEERSEKSEVAVAEQETSQGVERSEDREVEKSVEGSDESEEEVEYQEDPQPTKLLKSHQAEEANAESEESEKEEERVEEQEPDSEQEPDPEQPQKSILQVKDSEEESSDEEDSEKEETEHPRTTVERVPDTPQRVAKQTAATEKSIEQPQPAVNKDPHRPNATPVAPARVAQTLSAPPHASVTPAPSVRKTPIPIPSARTTSTSSSSIRTPPAPGRPSSSDSNEPYSDREASAAAIEKARGNKKEHRKAKKQAKKAAKRLQAAMSPTATSNAALASARRKTAAEANAAFDKAYHASPPPINAPCYRCRKTGHTTECACPWNPSLARDAASGVLRSVPFVRVPAVEFKLEGAGERREGGGGGREKKKGKKRRSEDEGKENEVTAEVKEKKKSKKRKMKQSGGLNGDADVGENAQTLRTSSLSL